MKWVRDIDNYFKALFDALEHAEVIKSDRYIVEIRATKIKSNNERLELIVKNTQFQEE